MKICYRIHPDDYDKKANEEFYEKMASEGWLLKKRWANLSKFEKTEPQQLKFDVYYSEYYSVSDEEKAEFEADGRTTVKVRSNVHVSYAPKSAQLRPVIKSNEDAANAIIPLKTKGARYIIELIIFWIAMQYTDWAGELTFNWHNDMPYISDLKYRIIAMPEIFIAIDAIVLFLLFIAVYEHFRFKEVIKIFKSGSNPDDRSRKKIIYIIKTVILIFSAVCIAITAYCCHTKETYTIPDISDGLYLDCGDMNIDDKLTSAGLYIDDEFVPNKVTHAKTLTAEMWHTQEYYHFGNEFITVYQDVVKYNNPKTALYAAELMISDEDHNYKETEVQGFEKVYVSGKEFIAVADNTVYHFMYTPGTTDVFPDTEQLLDTILKKH